MDGVITWVLKGTVSGVLKLSTVPDGALASTATVMVVLPAPTMWTRPEALSMVATAVLLLLKRRVPVLLEVTTGVKSASPKVLGSIDRVSVGALVTAASTVRSASAVAAA